ncbi:2OG-FeII-Oxy-2 domain-containing protein [Favolaschia claudopus]|uniref:2OG-FeII-Oxy-2 domain-containing protein n=1 Tax=Favolaschia claudopus TaxID=2862362 RepID=A0AAW0BDD9_9AGAR
MFKRTIGTFHRDFAFWPRFFSPVEQRILLTTALKKLDTLESVSSRRRRRTLLRGLPTCVPTPSTSLQDCFLPDECYDFQEGHYDGVIKHYREMHLTSWPSDVPELPPLLERLHSLFPSSSQDVQTHLLHLASKGQIQPHTDNLSASGSWILGVSLGDERILQLNHKNGDGDSFQVSLPSGSVYIQRYHVRSNSNFISDMPSTARDSLRYDYTHSIAGAERDAHSQRLSIMIRDRLPAQNV